MQCDEHERFVTVALGQGWTLWEYGTDSECIVGGKDAPFLTPIWIKPCAWDDSQTTPVGCLCCTDLNAALWDYSGELQAVIQARLIKMGKIPLPSHYEKPDHPKPLGGPVSWLPPYRAK